MDIREHRFCVAPMMERTDRHCRVLHRALSRHARLYSEMLTPEAVVHGHRERLLGFDPFEHPVALQLGGANPALLAEAASIGADYGYDEINLNVGCPSERVQAGRFGACLMQEPELVAASVRAMSRATSVPLTVKCRIGVDEQNPEIALRDFVARLADAGVRVFIIHARKAWLKGLSPRENREVPPLDYALVHAIKRENPSLTVVINGGIEALDTAAAQLERVDGVMLGRAAYHAPSLLCDVDHRFFGAAPRTIDDALPYWLDYVARRLKDGVPLNAMSKHMLGLFGGQPGARLFRRHLSENATRPGAGLATLTTALAYVRSPQAVAA